MSEPRDILSPSALHVLADEGEARKVIPADIRQEELVKIGELASNAARFPDSGETATLAFSDGTSQDVRVDGYDKNKGKPLVQIGVGKEQATSSNIDMSAFQNLTQKKQ